MHPFDFVRRAPAGALLVAFVALAALACSRGDSPAADALEAQSTRAALSAFAGGEPERCVFSAPNLELCVWRVGAEDPAWASQASAAETDGEVNLICELPIDGSPRAEGSCLARARAVRPDAEEGALPAVSAPGSLEARREAEQRLAEALTVRELALALGDAPDRCRTGVGVQTCEWTLADGTAGHALVDALVDDAGSGGAVSLACVLPLDGSQRATDSCSASRVD